MAGRAGRLGSMGGATVTAVAVSYAPDSGPPIAPALERLEQLVGESLAVAGGRSVLRDAARPVVVFVDPAEAVAAARHFRAAAVDLPAGQLVRIAVSTGITERHVVRHAQRLNEIANPGQLLLSALTVEIASATASTADADSVGGLFVDLGLHRLRDLGAAERVFAVQGPAGEALRSLDGVPNNLPVMFTSFVGRQAELGALRAQVMGHRLVTLTGPGGSGKTRLAAQIAAELADRWPDGVWWIDLAPVTDGGQVPELVASAVGVLAESSARSGPLIASQLSSRKALLCFDNCEHLLDSVPEFVVTVQVACPEITVLTTSREPLDVAGEAVWRVPALTASEAVSLFVERAGPGFTTDEEAEQAIRTICARLDGIPLALELATAWLRTLTPQQIEAGLDDRFGLLVRSTRGVAARQQTLASSIDWSYDLLDIEEREVFRSLAVFVGGFTLEAAAAVYGPTGLREVIGRLVDKSLVVAADARYRLVETIREYAAMRLAGELDGLRDRHLDHFLRVAEETAPELERNRDAWRAVIEPERENFRAALDHGLSGAETAKGRRLAAALPWLWNLQGTGQEGIAYLRRAIESSPDDRSLLQARLFYGYATVADTAAPFGYDAAERGLELATEMGDDRLRARCLAMVAVRNYYLDFQAAWDRCEEGRSLAEAIGDEVARDANLGVECLLLVLWDRHDEARPLLETVSDGLIARGERGIATAMVTLLSDSLASTGELPLAVETARKAFAIAEPLGDLHRVGMARGQVAQLLGRSGELDAALELMHPFLRLIENAGTWVPSLGKVMGDLYRWNGEYEKAIDWLRRDVPTEGPVADTYIPAVTLPALGTALRQAGRLDEAAEALDRAVVLARRYKLPRILADALEQQGYLALDEDPEKAADLLHESLTLRVDHGLRLYWQDSLDALTLLAEQTNRPKDAERIAQLDLDEAVAYVRRTRGARGRPSTGWASLTPTERDVVAAAVEGLNNPEIGARLFMSRGTVKTHLAHIYTKLGVANRTELAALAAKRT